MGVGVLLGLVIGLLLRGLGVQGVGDLRARLLEGRGLGRRDAGQLDHGEAARALDRARALAGLHGEHRLAHLGIGDGALGRIGVADRLDAIAAGDRARILALGQTRGHGLGLGGVLGGDLHERAALGHAELGLLGVELLLHVGRLGLQRGLDRLGADAHEAELARLRPAQPRGQAVHELGELSVGRLGRRRDGMLVQHEVVGDAALLIQRTEQGCVGKRRPQAGDHPRRELHSGDLVAQLLFEQRDGEAVLGQERLIGLLVEAAGDRVEEGGDLAQLLHQELVGGLHAGPANGFLHGFRAGQVLQQLLDRALVDRLLGRDRLAGSLLDVLQRLVEAVLEVGGRDPARAGPDHVVADSRVEDVPYAPDGEADDQKAHQHDGRRRFVEGSECGHHGGGLPGALRPVLRIVEAPERGQGKARGALRRTCRRAVAWPGLDSCPIQPS